MVLSNNRELLSAHGIKKEVVHEMMLTLGELRDRWWTQWSDRVEYLNEDGTFVCKTKRPLVSGQFLKIGRISPEESQVFESLLRKMVVLRDREQNFSG